MPILAGALPHALRQHAVDAHHGQQARGEREQHERGHDLPVARVGGRQQVVEAIHAVRGLLGIDRAQRRQHVRNQCSRIARCPEHDVQHEVRTLGMRQIDVWPRLAARPAEAHVANHSHDFVGEVGGAVVHDQPPPHRRLAGPQPPGERLAHHDHRRRGGGVAIVERPARDDAQAEGVDIPRRDDAYGGRRVLGLGRERALRPHGPIEVRPERAGGHGGGTTHRRHAWQRGQALEQRAVVGARPFTGTVGLCVEEDRRHEHALGLEARSHGGQRTHALHEEQRAEQQHHGQRHLPHHHGVAQAVTRRAGRAGRRLAHRRHRREAGAAPRLRHARQPRCQRGHRRSEEQGPPIDRRLATARQVRHESRQRANGHHGNERAQHASDATQEPRLHQELAHEPPGRGAQRESDGGVAGAVEAAHQRQ